MTAPGSLEYYLALPWTIRAQRRTDDGSYWAAETEELPGLVAAGKAGRSWAMMLQDALVSYLGAALEAGESIPEPGRGFRSRAS